MITYNHEKYIRQAVEGVLSQEVSFKLELNIFNDASIDRTDQIIKEIIKNHPKGLLIKYHVHEKNIGLSANYIWSVSNCKGKYVAICEGDDYWIDNYKLQKQLDYLEENKDYSLCFHQALRLNMVANEYTIYPQTDCRSFDAKSFFGLTTIPMASVMFRNEGHVNFIMGHSQMDFQLLCNLLSRGKAYFTNEVMSVYRVHEKGATFHHFTAPYLMNRIRELKIETDLPELSSAVQREVGGLYVKHISIMIKNFRNELSRKDVMMFLRNSLMIKKPKKSFFKEYRLMLKAFSHKNMKPGRRLS